MGDRMERRSRRTTVKDSDPELKTDEETEQATPVEGENEQPLPKKAQSGMSEIQKDAHCCYEKMHAPSTWRKIFY